MRKVTEQTVAAFMRQERKAVGNTASDGEQLTLHGNVIAYWNDGKLYISNAGWATSTTKERLNGILDYVGLGRIYQKAFEWYWKDGESFPSGQFVEIPQAYLR